MLIHVRFRPRRQPDRSIAVPTGATVMDLMEAAGAHVDTYVPIRGGTPIAEDETLVDGEEILLMSAASGG